MLVRALRRFGAILLLLIVLFLSVKVVIRTLPGDPVDALLAETGANIDPEILRKSLGLDEPYLVASFHQLRRLIGSFDFGRSILLKEPITPLILKRGISSFILGLTAITIALSFSLFFAFLTELSGRGRPALRRILGAASALSIALPTAWIGPILGLFLAVKFGWFHLTGGLALPALTLALSLSGFWLRVFHETLVEESCSDFARTARAKGLPERKILWKHVFLPSAGPFVAYLGSQTGFLFAGAVITESLFDRPGLGSLLVESIFRRDYPVIEAVLITSSALILMGTFLGDFAQEALNPRLRLRRNDE
ncbi:MAG: ABC transporter permease [Cryobacterium sp.]|nr:ABC transporter permease [Oligoflexia bacterium]